MKALVTGACGMLGTELCRQLAGAGHQVIRVDVNAAEDPAVLKTDIRDHDAIARLMSQAAPGVIYHLAAETNVDLCEENPDHAFRTNALGTEHLAIASARGDIPLVYISTAAVFDGSKGSPYTEFDAPNPINVYGKSKRAGEEAVQRLAGRHFIFRAGWMVGGWEIDKKFVYKIVQQVLSGKRVIQAVDDKFGSPTFTDDFSRNLLSVVRTGRYGLYHLAGKGSGSRYDIARRIVSEMRGGRAVKVMPIPSSAFPLPAPRPAWEALRNYKLDLLDLNRMLPWQENLRRYLRNNLIQTPSAQPAETPTR